MDVLFQFVLSSLLPTLTAVAALITGFVVLVFLAIEAYKFISQIL